MSELNNLSKMKIEIECVDNNEMGLDLIKPLWEKLREHGRARSQHFADHQYEGRHTWPVIRNDLLEKARTGGLRIELAKDANTGELIAYCVSSVSSDRQGRLEQIFIESDYRGHGVGDGLMQKALRWMNDMQAKTKSLVVGGGNEGVFTFYSRYGFYPKHITLEQVENRS